MRADRLLSILLLLQIERRITTAELARRLEVSDRTIHRDMDALSAAGVPVVAARGTGGGWFLLDEYRTDLTGLSEAESQTLFLTTPTRLIADLGLARAASGALIKLRAALPRQQQPGAEDVRQRIHIDAAGWRQTEGALPAMPVLQEALWGNQRLWIRYRRSDDSESERTLDPLGLVAKGNLWYLIAASEGEIRTYRVSRIVAATLLDHPVTRPAGFDLAGYWAQSSREFLSRLPQYRATVRVAPHVLRMIRNGGRFARIEEACAPDAEGWTALQMLFEGEAGAREFVLGFGTQIAVIEPETLRENVLREAQGVVARYQVADDASLAETETRRSPRTAANSPRAMRREDGDMSRHQ